MQTGTHARAGRARESEGESEGEGKSESERASERARARAHELAQLSSPKRHTGIVSLSPDAQERAQLRERCRCLTFTTGGATLQGTNVPSLHWFIHSLHAHLINTEHR